HLPPPCPSPAIVPAKMAPSALAPKLVTSKVRSPTDRSIHVLPLSVDRNSPSRVPARITPVDGTVKSDTTGGWSTPCSQFSPRPDDRYSHSDVPSSRLPSFARVIACPTPSGSNNGRQ